MSTIEKAIQKLKAASGTGNNTVVGYAGGANSSAGKYEPHLDPSKVVCHLDSYRLKQSGLLTPSSADEALAEQYRILKRPLLDNAFNRQVDYVENSNSVMITSSIAGEGKTYTSFNLAISMAMELNNTVLLIDTDVIKASLTKILGLEGRLGLVDLLLKPNLNLSDLLVSTDIPRLKVLPAGNPSVNSTELLASEQMSHIAHELSRRYHDRMILYDAPPLLVTSQAKVLANLVGQILLVIEANYTPKELVKECVSLIDPNKILGVALNKSRASINKDIYGGYYGSSK